MGFKGQVICAWGKVTVEKQRHFFLGGKAHQRPLFSGSAMVLTGFDSLQCVDCFDSAMCFFFRFVDASVPIFNLTVSVPPVVGKSPWYIL